MIILLTILIILYALTSCKEKIQEKKGNEDNWKVYQQLEEKEEQSVELQKMLQNESLEAVVRKVTQLTDETLIAEIVAAASK